MYLPYDYPIGNELLVVAAKQLPNLQFLQMNLNGPKWVFKDVAMQLMQNSFKMKNLNFVFCQSDRFIFHPDDLVELNKSRSLISGASFITIRLDYHIHYKNFEKPVFIPPPKVFCSLKFTALNSNYEF